MEIDADKLVVALRDVKHKEFNLMVRGAGRQPAEVVDSVVFAIRHLVDDAASNRLFNEVINYYPDYVPGRLDDDADPC